MPWKLSMIFYKIFENFWNIEHTTGPHQLATRVESAPAWPCGPHVPPPLIPAPIQSFLQKKSLHSSNSCSCSSCCHFRSPCSKFHSKLLWGIALRYVTPSMVQLVFVLVLYLLQIFAAVVTLFLSLHVKFIWSKLVVSMHDIASRHL